MKSVAILTCLLAIAYVLGQGIAAHEIQDLNWDYNYDCYRNGSYSFDCEDSRYPYPTDCSRYYRCTPLLNCTAYVFLCPDGFHFDPFFKECRLASNFSCVSSTTVVPTTSELETTDTPEITTELETTEVPEITTAPPALPDGVGFFAGLTSNMESAGIGEAVVFDDVPINMGGRLRDNSVFTADEGIHFFSYSVEINETDTATVMLDGIGGAIQTNATNYDGTNLIFRNVLEMMDDGQETTFHTEGDLMSDSGMQTSWTGFSLHSLFSPVMAFACHMNQARLPQGVIPWDEIDVDTHNAINETTYRFMVPETGLYYISYSAGHLGGVQSRVGLVHLFDNETGIRNVVELWKNDNTHNAPTMHSRSTLVRATAGDAIWLVNFALPVNSDPIHHQTAWVGFKYNPIHGPSVAWSVHRHTPAQGAFGLDPVDFTVIEVNEGGVYDNETHLFNIPVSGYYYLEVNIGILRGLPTNVGLYRNEEILANTRRRVSNHNNQDSVGRSLITKLEAGDVVKLVLYPHNGIFSDPDKHTSFNGFLLNAID